jgi:hypothetical protein
MNKYSRINQIINNMSICVNNERTNSREARTLIDEDIDEMEN